MRLIGNKQIKYEFSRTERLASSGCRRNMNNGGEINDEDRDEKDLEECGKLRESLPSTSCRPSVHDVSKNDLLLQMGCLAKIFSCWQSVR